MNEYYKKIKMNNSIYKKILLIIKLIIFFDNKIDNLNICNLKLKKKNKI